MSETPTRLSLWAWICLAGLVLAWRFWAIPVSRIWRDWIVILVCYALFTAFASKSRAWPVVTAATTAFLLGIYVHGYLPHALSVFGIPP